MKRILTILLVAIISIPAFSQNSHAKYDGTLAFQYKNANGTLTVMLYSVAFSEVAGYDATLEISGNEKIYRLTRKDSGNCINLYWDGKYLATAIIGDGNMKLYIADKLYTLPFAGFYTDTKVFAEPRK